MVDPTFPPVLDYGALLPWTLYIVATWFLARFVRSVSRLAERVNDHGERIATVEGVLVADGKLERRHAHARGGGDA